MSRVLAIDYGRKRNGAAVSDPGRSIASPLEVYERRSETLDAAHYRELVKEERVGLVVVGLPLHTGGGESQISREAREFGAWLGRVTGATVRFHDERYTSVLAEEVLNTHKLTTKRRKQIRDQLAAQILLQSFLDQGCPELEAPSRPISDDPDRGRP